MGREVSGSVEVDADAVTGSGDEAAVDGAGDEADLNSLLPTNTWLSTVVVVAEVVVVVFPESVVMALMVVSSDGCGDRSDNGGAVVRTLGDDFFCLDLVLMSAEVWFGF